MKNNPNTRFIAKSVRKFERLLRRSTGRKDPDIVQEVLANTFDEEVLEILKRRLYIYEMMSSRTVDVDFAQTVKETTKSIWGKKEIDIKERAGAIPTPKQTGKQTVEVFFFHLHESESNDDSEVHDYHDLNNCFRYRGLIPAHPLHIIAFHKKYPKLSAKYPLYTHWPIGITGYWSCATISKLGFSIDQCGDYVVANWWFAGVKDLTIS